MIQHIEDTFYKGAQPLSRALFASEHPSSRIIKLEESTNYFYAAEGLNTSDENSALVHYIQVHLKLQLLFLSSFCSFFLMIFCSSYIIYMIGCLMSKLVFLCTTLHFLFTPYIWVVPFV